MLRALWRRLYFCLLFLTTPFLYSQQQLAASEAAAHIGDNATVCGQVISVHFSARSRGEPTFLNLDKPYPNQIFTILIWGEDRPKFGNLETRFSEARVCVRGTITAYRGEPEIVVHDPSSLTLVKK
jgi:hypothetical protein